MAATTTIANEEHSMKEKLEQIKLNDDETIPADCSLSSEHTDTSEGYKTDDAEPPIKCSAVHTLERDMPDFDYSHLVKQLRQMILDQHEENPGLYSQMDIDKCKTDDWHLSRFLLRHKLDLDAAFNMLCAQLRFKNESLYNTIRPEDFPAEFYQVGGMFGYEHDRKGNKMLYIRVKTHRKIPEISAILEGFVLYNIQNLDEKADGKGISIVFDCTGAGLASADVDLLLLIIQSLKNYFPKGLSYFLVHNLPWILKPIWHLAKQFISEEHSQLIKFSNSDNIYEYVDRDKLPDFMGGTCTKSYTTPPDNCTTLEEAAKIWGIESTIIRKVVWKFKDYLPKETLERIEKNFAENNNDNNDDDHQEAN